MKYARENPELTLLSVNTFVQDCEDKNPLIRSLALRTMGCLRVQSVVEYLVPLLDKALNDVDPYVRKTAAVCVAKLYDMAPERCEEEGLHPPSAQDDQRHESVRGVERHLRAARTFPRPSAATASA